MRWTDKFRLRLRSLFRRAEIERELDSELRFHLERQIQENLAAGMPPDEAHYAALRTVGGLAHIKDECRDVRRTNWVESFARDTRYALRVLRKSPGFTVTTVLTLALGIGANAGIFSMVNGILLRALPYDRPDELYVLREAVQVGNQINPSLPVNAGNFLQWRRECRAFSDMAALEPSTDNLNLATETVQVHGGRASASLLSILGVQPQLGRGFLPEEDETGRDKVVILTNQLWRAWFDSDPQIIGKRIALNGYAHVVVGVLPAGFYFPKPDQLYGQAIAGWTSPIQYFRPLGLQPWEIKPRVGNFNFTVIARLKPGVSRRQAFTDIDSVESRIAKADASGAGLHAELWPMKTAVVGPAQDGLWVLMAGAGVLLLIVCVNVASLLLARNTGRAHEIAVRTALGASRSDLLRQFLSEGLLLATGGGALGVLAAVEGLRAIIHSAPVNLPRLESIHVDTQVLLFSIAISLAAGMLFSVLPGLGLSRTQPVDSLKSAAPTASAALKTARLHDAMAGSEIALCAMLLIAALLLARSLGRVLKANEWLEVQNVLAVDLVPPPDHYQDSPQRQRLYQALLEAVTALPGVRAAGLINALPLQGEQWGDDVNFQEAPRPVLERPIANFRLTSPDYFRAIGLPLTQGRLFAQADHGKDVIVISEGIAKKVLRGRNPIGMHFLWTRPNEGKERAYDVIGVVGEARSVPDREPPFTVYLPYWQWSPSEVSLVVRTAGDPRTAASDLRKTIRRVDIQIAIPREETLREILSAAVAPRRFLTWLGVLFAVSATVLAALGLYGVISLSVTRRRHEIGIRMALGANVSDVLRMVIIKGMKVAVTGLVLGLACAYALTRLMASILYGVRPTDPAAFGTVCVILAAVALLGSYVPARRATKVDPMVALRYE